MKKHIVNAMALAVIVVCAVSGFACSTSAPVAHGDTRPAPAAGMVNGQLVHCSSIPVLP